MRFSLFRRLLCVCLLFGLSLGIFPAYSYASDDFNIDVPFSSSDYSSFDDYLYDLNNYLNPPQIVPFGTVDSGDLNTSQVHVRYYVGVFGNWSTDEYFSSNADLAFTKQLTTTTINKQLANSQSSASEPATYISNYLDPLFGYTATFEFSDNPVSNFDVVFDVDFSRDIALTVNDDIVRVKYYWGSSSDSYSITTTTAQSEYCTGYLTSFFNSDGYFDGDDSLVPAIRNHVILFANDSSGGYHVLGEYDNIVSGSYEVSLPDDIEIVSVGFDNSYYMVKPSSVPDNFSTSSPAYAYYFFPYAFKADFSGSITLDDSGIISGLISSIIEWLKSILNAIKALPQQIADLVVEGIKTLFVPSSESIMATFDSLKAVAEDKLGFLYTIFNMVYDLFNSLISGVLSPTETITIPRFAFPFSFVEGGEIVLWEEMTFDILPDGLSDFLNIIKTVTSILLITATMSHCVEYLRAFFRKE